MSKEKRLWSCSGCGHKQPKWSGSCPSCQEWNTLIEELSIDHKGARFDLPPGLQKSTGPRPIKEIDPSCSFKRISTGMGEVDRLLGGGLVAGSLILVGGDPGIGKSTLLLQIAQLLASQGQKVLYISGEESEEQTSLRARRLGVSADLLFLFSETLFSQIKWHVEQLRPQILIVDSIQILYKGEIPSAPGSVVQVREVAAECMHMAKKMGMATFLIGHVTKSGEIAGPRVLEHLVDTVLEFEGDRQHGHRFLRASKNRFGPTDDIALFQMQAEGLVEIVNPSLLFLQEKTGEAAGSVIIPTIEGTRAILVEVQALVASSSFSTSTRRSTGLDQNRLALLLAVLEKRMGYHLYKCDVFVSVAGGLKITEPAIDLGVLVAIASSFRNHALDLSTVVMGEVGLNGEVRGIPRVESRLKEVIHMGFSRCILPNRNLKALPAELSAQITLCGIEKVEEAIDLLLQ